MGSLTALLLASAVMNAPDGCLLLDHPVYIPSYRDILSYDDGTSYWVCWEGTQRGVWFNTADFYPPSGRNWSAEETEFWFFHSPSYPWDTASFYAELYDGGASGPGTLLNRTSVTAVHYEATYAFYNPCVECGYQFWVIQNACMSGGGWPSILSDNSPLPVVHSFCDGQPWERGNYIIRTACWTGLQSDTWAGIKSLFD